MNEVWPYLSNEMWCTSNYYEVLLYITRKRTSTER